MVTQLVKKIEDSIRSRPFLNLLGKKAAVLTSPVQNDSEDILELKVTADETTL